MDWPDYLRDQAAKYRQLAEQTDDPVIKNELLELASVCEEVARNIDGSPDRRELVAQVAGTQREAQSLKSTITAYTPFRRAPPSYRVSHIRSQL